MGEGHTPQERAKDHGRASNPTGEGPTPQERVLLPPLELVLALLIPLRAELVSGLEDIGTVPCPFTRG